MIEDSCLSYRYCLPNKLFEYVMAEIPILVSNLPEMKTLVEKYQVGVIIEDSSSNSIENALVKAKLLDKKILKNNIAKVKDLYNWEEQEKKLLKVYRSLVITKNEQ
jgi:glycosyltransferase involved in cell wall biosynthesis